LPSDAVIVVQGELRAKRLIPQINTGLRGKSRLLKILKTSHRGSGVIAGGALIDIGRELLRSQWLIATKTIHLRFIKQPRHDQSLQRYLLISSQSNDPNT
jgi:hypothetical protein